MKFTFLFTGKTKISYIKTGVEEYFNRLKHYINCEIIIVPDLKNTRNMTAVEQMKKEGDLILKNTGSNSLVILFDEKGKKMDSASFSGFLEKKCMEGKDIMMVMGGAYGFSKEVKSRADIKISLSDMTFSHQMVRLILMEQVYRAFTIINGEPYHHS